MDVDIRIYVQRLKDFFDNDEDARRDMFGAKQLDLDKFYLMVTKKATSNFKEKGDPILSSMELLEIVADIAMEDAAKELNIQELIESGEKGVYVPNDINSVFVHFKDGFPPICLN